MRYSMVIIFAACLLTAAPAWADCDLAPNGTTILAPETRPIGTMIYNSDHQVFQGCAEDHWVSLNISSAGGIGPSFDGPTDCPAIGDLCADGTVYAGYHPTLHERLFIPPTDQEKPGNPGTFTMEWKTSNGTDDINPEDSTDDGKINHANGQGMLVDFPAFQACESWSFGGHVDWYLPAQVELYYLWSVRDEIEEKGNITGFQGSNYWSSTEYGPDYAWAQTFSYGLHDIYYKDDTYRVRCVRR